MRKIALLTACLSLSTATIAAELPDGTWGLAETRPILEKTLRLHLNPDRSELAADESAAIEKLLRAGELMHELYLDQLHAEALRAQNDLTKWKQAKLAGAAELLDVFELNRGPIATTFDNRRLPILPVAPELPGKNVYPSDLTKEEFDTFLSANPQRRGELLHVRSVVRRATKRQVAADLKLLDRHPGLQLFHPGLRERLLEMRRDPSAVGFYALGYSVVYADRMLEIHRLLNEAANLVADEAFARYLRLRSRDLLADDYDGGDAAWVTSSFSGNLNAEIGSYETYDDALYGVKSFFAFNVLIRDRPRSDELRAAIGDIQAIENALPYDAHKRVRSDIPVGVYNVLADFGQSRGTNTATILPNESHLSRQYGRTILIRANILTDPQLFAISRATFSAATAPEHHAELALEGGFYRTLWHEIGHYLGPDRTHDGRDLDVALQDCADLLEEMKADLASLFAMRMLLDKGVHTPQRARAIEASGILRVLQNNQPRRSQPYQTMQLMQWNWYLEHGLLRFTDGVLHIDYSRYAENVESLLREVLKLQNDGDYDAATAFVDRWTRWDENTHGVIAQRIRDTQRYRFRLVSYQALAEPAAP